MQNQHRALQVVCTGGDEFTASDSTRHTENIWNIVVARDGCPCWALALSSGLCLSQLDSAQRNSFWFSPLTQ